MTEDQYNYDDLLQYLISIVGFTRLSRELFLEGFVKIVGEKSFINLLNQFIEDPESKALYAWWDKKSPLFPPVHQQLVKQLQIEEGFRSTPYKDTQGYWSIAWGFNFQGRPITEEEHQHLFPNERYPMTLSQMVAYWKKNPISKENAEYLLEEMIAIAESNAKVIYGELWNKIPNEKKVPILDALYNLGMTRYKGFKRHIAAVKKMDWEKAANEILDSLAARQCPTRYKRIARELRGVVE